MNDLTGYLLDRSGASLRSAGGRANIEGRARDRRVSSGNQVRKAAVLILLSEPGAGALLAEPASLASSGVDVVLTERSATLRSHPSQVAFPGGGLDPGERAIDAALREANVALTVAG